jgi:hypothetical protein
VGLLHRRLSGSRLYARQRRALTEMNGPANLNVSQLSAIDTERALIGRCLGSAPAFAAASALVEPERRRRKARSLYSRSSATRWEMTSSASLFCLSVRKRSDSLWPLAMDRKVWRGYSSDYTHKSSLTKIAVAI